MSAVPGEVASRRAALDAEGLLGAAHSADGAARSPLGAVPWLYSTSTR